MHLGPRPTPSLEPAIQHALRQARTYQIHALPDWPYRQPREQERERWKQAAFSSARSPTSRSFAGSDFSSKYGFRLLNAWAKRPWAVTGSHTIQFQNLFWRIDAHDCDIREAEPAEHKTTVRKAGSLHTSVFEITSAKGVDTSTYQSPPASQKEQFETENPGKKSTTRKDNIQANKIQPTKDWRQIHTKSKIQTPAMLFLRNKWAIVTSIIRTP